MRKRIFGLLFALIISVSSFAFLVASNLEFIQAAAPIVTTQPIQTILDILQNQIAGNVTAIYNQNVGLRSSLENTTQIIGYYSGSVGVGSSGILPNSTVLTNKPALFTVSFHAIIAGYIFVYRNETFFGQNRQFVVKSYEAEADSPIIQDAFTFAGEGVSLSAQIGALSTAAVDFTIMVQGTPGTVITSHS